MTTKLLYRVAGPIKLARRCSIAPLTRHAACRHFSNEDHGMKPSNVGRQIYPNTLLPYAVAQIEASQLPRPLFDHSVISLLNDLYYQPARLAVRHNCPTAWYDGWATPTVLSSPQQPILLPSPWSVSLAGTELHQPLYPSRRPSSFVFVAHFTEPSCFIHSFGAARWPTMQTTGFSGDNPLGRTRISAVSTVTWKESLAKVSQPFIKEASTLPANII